MARKPSLPPPNFSASVGAGPFQRRLNSTEHYEAFYAGKSQKDMAEVIRQFEALVTLMQGATPGIVEQVIEPVFQLSQIYVPIDTGDLYNSGRLDIQKKGTQVRAQITYGGPDVRYAAIVHERLDVFHQPPTRAKYLQSAMEESVFDMKDEIIEAYAHLLGIK